MPNGKVKWFHSKKGYGFICQDNGEEIFVHFSEIKSEEQYKNLEQDQPVTFEVAEGKNGLYAKNVVVVK